MSHWFTKKSVPIQLLIVGLITVACGLFWATVWVLAAQPTPAPATVSKPQERWVTESLRQRQFAEKLRNELDYSADQPTLRDLLQYGGKLESPHEKHRRVEWSVGGFGNDYKGNLRVTGADGESQEAVSRAARDEWALLVFGYPQEMVTAGRDLFPKATDVALGQYETAKEVAEVEKAGYKFRLMVVNVKINPKDPERWQVLLAWWPRKDQAAAE